MSDALRNRDGVSDNGASDPLEYTFDPSTSGTPSLRPPKLSEAGLQAAIQLGFNETYLPSSVTGGGGDRNSSMDRSNNSRQSASMMNNQYNNHQSGPQNQSPLFVDNYNLGLTDEQLQGLLPALRRPDANQIPPDVLAVLLKSSKFDDIIMPTQRRLVEMSSNANHSQQQQQSQRNQYSDNMNSGRDGSVAPANNPGSTNTARVTAQESPEPRFRFSPNAAEFVPTTYQSPNMQQQQESSSDLAYAMSQVQFQDHRDPFQSLTEDFEGSDCILSTVTDMISQVSLDPASRTRYTKTSIEVLKKYLNDEDTLGIVVTLVIEQMISNTNFCYSGAKILEAFREGKVGAGIKDIKNLLLTRMKEEFDHCLNKMDEVGDPEIRARMLGVVRVFGELYMYFGVLPDNSKLKILALAVLELMEKLLKANRSLDSIRCICQLLKLIGLELENSKQPEVQKCLKLVIDQLKNILQNSSELEPSGVTLINMIIKLESNKWNTEQAAPPSAQTQSGNTSQAAASSYAGYTQTQYPVYEMPDSDDDFGYDDGDGEIYLDDESLEVQEAYEEFLKMTSNAK